MKAISANYTFIPEEEDFLFDTTQSLEYHDCMYQTQKWGQDECAENQNWVIKN